MGKCPDIIGLLLGGMLEKGLENKEKKTGEMLEEKSEHLPVFVWF